MLRRQTHVQRDGQGRPLFRVFEQWTEEGRRMAELQDQYRIDETLELEKDLGFGVTTTVQACVEGQVVSEYDLMQFEAAWGKRPKVTSLAEPEAVRTVAAPVVEQPTVEVEQPKVASKRATKRPASKKAPAKKAAARKATAD